MNGYIYKIENKVNGKAYIGQTRQKIGKRFTQHRYSLNKGNHKNVLLQLAWSKYGGENFTFEIIKNCDINDLDEIEIREIKRYMSEGKSYNIELGGNTNKEVTDITRKRMSLKAKRRFSDESYRIKNAAMVKESWEKGKYDSRKKLLRETCNDFICIDNMKVYKTMSELSEELGVNPKSVYNMCTGQMGSAYGNGGKRYQIAYYVEGKEYKLKELPTKAKKVKCITTGEIYKSIAQASEMTGIRSGNIVRNCKGQGKSAGKLPDGTKLEWSYL
jgi:group I intron endonuclease